MGVPMSKITTALEKPEVILPYFKAQGRKVGSLLSDGRLGEAVTYLPTIVGFDTYTRYLERKTENGIIEREIQGNQMLLDIYDHGISQDLLVWGVREELPVNAYRDALRRLSDDLEKQVTILDLGANIGYFVLIAADMLGDDTAIYAVEPHPRNFNHLNRNIDRNGYTVTTVQGAIGSENGTATLHTSPVSNKHRVDGTPETGATVDTIDVPKWTVDTFCDEQGISAADVNVLRMDVEGHEIHVIEGAQDVLAADTPIIIYLELHINLLDSHQLDRIIEILAQRNLEIDAAFFDPPLLEGKRLDVSELDELRNLPQEGIQLILTRDI